MRRFFSFALPARPARQPRIGISQNPRGTTRPIARKYPQPNMPFSRLSNVFLFSALLAASAFAEDFQGSAQKLEYEEEPIAYSKIPPDDPVARLQRRLDAGEAKLAWDDKFGYLPGILDAFGIPKSSQMLVFSKTSLQRKLISPSNPRALYFNDDVYVGYIPDAPMMEVSTVDPQHGGIFYSIGQEKVRKPKFERNQDCMQCHGAQRTLGVPGHFVRSVPTDAMGELDTPNEISDITHCTSLADRWAGWYVTGQHGAQTHRGNLIGADAFARAKEEPNYLGNLTELGKFFDESKYLARGSDIVALMVLEHQAHMHNYITRLNFETQIMTTMYGHTRYLRHQENAFLRYLLFTEEAPLTAPLAGNPEFVAAFAKLGPRDSKGRSLRDFDLQTRMFKYPCSFLIYSDAFAQMAPVMKEELLRRLFAILTGTETHSDFANIPAADRQAILEILRETMPSLPDYWRIAGSTGGAN